MPPTKQQAPSTPAHAALLTLRACLLLAMLFCKPAAAQSIERVAMPEGSIKLIVPEGQCAIERDTEDGRRMYALAQRLQTTRILLLYAGCGDARRIGGARAGFDLRDYGIYSVPHRDGVPFKETRNATREELIDGYAKVFPAIDSALVERLVRPRAQGEGLGLSKLVIGTLERDANALYLGVSAEVGQVQDNPQDNPQGAAPAARKWSVAALTLVKGYMISHTLVGEPAPGAPFAAMLARQKGVAALLVEANP